VGALSGGLLAGIGYTCVCSLVSGGQPGRLRLIAMRLTNNTDAP
jgi:hypothetical protein